MTDDMDPEPSSEDGVNGRFTAQGPIIILPRRDFTPEEQKEIDEAMAEADQYDADFSKSYSGSPNCPRCIHYNGFYRCGAFPEGPIPLDIWLGRNPHSEPYEGDHGIRFELLERLKR